MPAPQASKDTRKEDEEEEEQNEEEVAMLRKGLPPGTPTAQCASEAQKTSKTETKARA